MSAPGTVSAQAWCTFRLAGGNYGVELARVQEVLRPLPVTRLPLAPRAIAGLINLRGRIVPVVDLQVVLGTESAPARSTVAPAGPTRGGFVVVRSPEGPMALLVDAIGDVRRGDDAPPPSLAAAPSTGREPDGPLIARTLALPGELLVVLDLDRVLARAFSEETRS